MKDLNEFGVQEINGKDLKEVEGGGLGLIIGLAGLAIAVLSVDWDQAADDFSRGWNSL